MTNLPPMNKFTTSFSQTAAEAILVKELDYQVRLQELMMEILSTFMNIEPDNLSLLIHESLEKLGLFLGAERVYVYEKITSVEIFKHKYEWQKEGFMGRGVTEPIISKLMYPEWWKAHHMNEGFVIFNLSNLENKLSCYYRLNDLGVKSLMAVPLYQKGQCMGMVGIDFISEPKPEILKLEKLVKVFAQMLMNLNTRMGQYQVIRERDAQLEAILNSSLESIWSLNSQLEITYANKIMRRDFKQAFGVELERGVNIIQFLPEAIQQVWRDRYLQVLEGQTLEFNEEVEAGNQVYYLHLQMFPVIVDGKVMGISVFSRNFTHEMNVIKDRNNYCKTVEMQNEVLRDIAWTQSHIVRAPLARLMGLVNLLQEDDGSLPLPVPELYAAIQISARELDQIIHGISDKTYMIEQLQKNFGMQRPIGLN